MTTANAFANESGKDLHASKNPGITCLIDEGAAKMRNAFGSEILPEPGMVAFKNYAYHFANFRIKCLFRRRSLNQRGLYDILEQIRV